MDTQTNTAANVSLGSAIGLIVLFMASFCLGLIPFVSLLNLLIYPLEMIVALVAIVAGIVGLSQARVLGGAGRPQAIVGIVIPVLWGMLQVLFLFMGVGLVFLVAMMENM